MDIVEAAINTALGLVVSMALIAVLRWLGMWDAPAWMISVVFVVASFLRSWVIRVAFRRRERLFSR